MLVVISTWPKCVVFCRQLYVSAPVHLASMTQWMLCRCIFIGNLRLSTCLTYRPNIPASNGDLLFGCQELRHRGEDFLMGSPSFISPHCLVHFSPTSRCSRGLLSLVSVSGASCFLRYVLWLLFFYPGMVPPAENSHRVFPCKRIHWPVIYVIQILSHWKPPHSYIFIFQALSNIVSVYFYVSI